MLNFLADLPQNVKAIADKGNLRTPEEVILTPSAKMALLQGATEHDIRVLKEAAAKIIAKQPIPVSALLKPTLSTKWSRLSFGCSGLDRCIRGGLITRGITEICGTSGVGKTQLLLQLSLIVQLPKELGGFGKGVAFICTEDVFPSRRLLQMSKVFAQRYPEHEINYLGHVYIEHIIESEDLLQCVSQRLKKLMESLSIGLIVIDSVAAIFRVYSNYIKRAQDMRKLANCLLHYADKYHCAVICVNQVTTVSDKDCDVPSLGLAWAHLGRTRIKISKVPKEVKINKQLLTVRKFEVMYSPETPNDFAEFLITDEGVIEVPQT